jgi:signal transduction histidine kinase
VTTVQTAALGVPYTYIGVAAALLGGLCGGYALDRREGTPGSVWFAATLITVGAYALGESLRLLTSPGDLSHALSLSGSLGPLAVFFWLAFALEHTGRKRWLRGPRLALVAAPPLAFTVLGLTNPLHGLVWNRVGIANVGGVRLMNIAYGPGGVAIAAMTFVYGTVGFALVTLLYLEGESLHRRRWLASFCGVLAVLASVAVGVLGLHPDPAVAVAPFGLAAAAPAFLYAYTRHGFFEVVPVPRRKAIEGMRGGVGVIDANGRVVDLNRQMAEVLDRPKSAVVGAEANTVLDAVVPELDFSVGSPPGTPTTTTVAARGRHYQVRQDPIDADSPGGPAGQVVVCTDITEQVRQRRELERQNERLDRFAEVVAHDLRNPLNVASGWAAEIEGEEGEHIRDAVGRMDDLIEDVLTVAREGEAVADAEPVDVAERAEVAWSSLDEGAVRLELDDPPTVAGDAGRVTRLLENLLRNAVEHGDTSDGGAPGGVATDGDAAITVTVGAYGRGFYVADDGPGVPADEREAVFEDGYTTRREGTGFGLSIVTAIVGAHGWSVELTESESGGARFEIET